MADYFEHGISHREVEKLGGYNQCLKDMLGLIKSITGHDPNKRMIDAVVILEKIEATAQYNSTILKKAQQDLDSIKDRIELAAAPLESKFLWVDKSGRGGKATFTKAEIQQDLSLMDETFDVDDLEEWFDQAEVGEEINNAANKIIRIS